MSVPFRKRLQRYLKSNVETIFSTPSWRIALNKATTRSIFGCAVSDETTPLVAGPDIGTFMAPRNLEIVDISASLTTAQTSGDPVEVDVNVNGVSILSSRLIFDNTVKSTIASSTPPELSKTKLLAGDEITIDIDRLGDGTATGLKVYLIVQL